MEPWFLNKLTIEWNVRFKPEIPFNSKRISLEFFSQRISITEICHEKENFCKKDKTKQDVN